MIKLLGLTGKKQSGKSTIAEVAEEEFGFTRVALAEPLKNFILQCWPAFSPGHLWGDLKEDMVAVYGKSGRQVMQELGTDVLRGYDPDIWVRAMQDEIEFLERMGGGYYIIDDIRFPNEVEMVKEMGGEVWKVVRSGQTEEDGHISELQALSGLSHILFNSLSLDLFKFKVRTRLQEFVDGA